MKKESQRTDPNRSSPVSREKERVLSEERKGATVQGEEHVFLGLEMLEHLGDSGTHRHQRRSAAGQM